MGGPAVAFGGNSRMQRSWFDHGGLDLLNKFYEKQGAIMFPGGNTGAQTVSTLIRGLALGEVRLHDVWKVLLRELTGGVLLGLLLGVVAFGMALVNGHAMNIATVVGSAIVVICTWANVMGALVPLIARKFSLDPALVSAPMIATLVDATGLAIYLTIAKVILGL